MANIKFTNFARSKLTVGISTGSTTITITGASGALFPALTAGQYFYATLENAALAREIVKVTARTGDSLTVTRAQDNTTASAWNAGDTFALRFNAAAIADTLADLSAGNYSGNLAFTGTGNRITGDFSNATAANRVMFQSSTLDGQTSIGVLPNGTSTITNLNLFGGANPTNASVGQYVNTGTEVRLGATVTGTGTYLPMTFYAGGSERMRISTDGLNAQVSGAGTGSSIFKSNGGTAGYGSFYAGNSGNAASANYIFFGDAGGERARITQDTGNTLIFSNGSGAVDRMRIDASGNVTVTSPAGLGYGTGAGGTVTQATSRTTAVTLNKPTGLIAMFAAAGSATPSQFQVNNSIVSATDTITLNVRGGATNIYALHVGSIGNGFFTISFWAQSGTASDSPNISFTIIKGAVS